jgi:hypothetical protein
MKAAYFFDYEMGDTAARSVHLATHEHVEEWRKSWRSEARHSLTYRRTSDGILIDFNYGPERQGTYNVTGVNAVIYEFCTETMRTPDQVAAHLLTLSAEHQYPADEIRQSLDAFCGKRLMLTENDKYLGLALPSNPNW